MDIQYQPPDDSGNPLEKFTVNLTALAKSGKIDPVIGRNEEVRRVMQILARRTKNNPVLLGDPGVGKTAIVEGLAQRIVSGDVPETLKNKELLSLDIASLLAGASFRGQFEDRIKKILVEVEKSNGKYILFMDEMHTLVGAGAAEGAMDAANILKPALARGKLHAIGATTIKEYRQYVEKDAALERRFQPVYVEEPSIEDSIAILRGIKEKYELHHGIRITDDALIAAVHLSVRYITDRYLPDKAIDLIDEAASSIKIETESMPYELDQLKRTITQREIEAAALKRDKAAKDRLKTVETEIEELRQSEKALTARWQSQKEIIGTLQKYRAQMDFLRLELEKAEREALLEKAAEIKYGKIPETEKKLKEVEKQWNAIPSEERVLREEVTEEDIARVVARWTGIPVTRLLSSESEKLVHLEDELKTRVMGQDEALHKVAAAIRRNRAGIAEQAKPIGSFLFLGPTGVGKTETAKALAEYLLNDERALIRIDMSEYQEPHTVARLIGAPPGYIGYDEGGQLTEAVRRKPYSVVLFDEIEKAHPQVFNVFLQILDDGRLTDGRGRTVNFKNTVIIMTSNIASDLISEYSGKSEDALREKVTDVLRKTFRPEFLNRIDQTVIYHRLTVKLMEGIVEKELLQLTNRVSEQGIKIDFSAALKKHLADIGYDERYGARPLKRAIQDTVLDELALQIIEKKVGPGSHVMADYKDGKVRLNLPN